MVETFGEWQVVARKTHHPILHLFGILLQMLLLAEPATYSSATWTLRHTGTGAIRKVTARSKDEARLLVTANKFDPEPAA